VRYQNPKIVWVVSVYFEMILDLCEFEYHMYVGQLQKRFSLKLKQIFKKMTFQERFNILILMVIPCGLAWQKPNDFFVK
jgi:hypothetical protein